MLKVMVAQSVMAEEIAVMENLYRMFNCLVESIGQNIRHRRQRAKAEWGQRWARKIGRVLPTRQRKDSKEVAISGRIRWNDMPIGRAIPVWRCMRLVRISSEFNSPMARFTFTPMIVLGSTILSK
jgi:hypothetical protein